LPTFGDSCGKARTFNKERDRLTSSEVMRKSKQAEGEKQKIIHLFLPARQF
jgi:hypothetical protein